MKKIVILSLALASLNAAAWEINATGGYDFSRFGKVINNGSKIERTYEPGWTVGLEVLPYDKGYVDLGIGTEYNFGTKDVAFKNSKDGSVPSKRYMVPVYGVLKAKFARSKDNKSSLYALGRLGYAYSATKGDTEKHNPNNLYYGAGLGFAVGPFVIEGVYGGTYTRDMVATSGSSSSVEELSNDSKPEGKKAADVFRHKLGLRIGMRFGDYAIKEETPAPAVVPEIMPQPEKELMAELIKVPYNHTLTAEDAMRGIKDYATLPKGTTFRFLNPESVNVMKPGKYDNVQVEVKYPDGTTKVVTTSVLVGDMASVLEPTPKPITVEYNHVLTAKDAANCVAEANTFPQGTTFSFLNPEVVDIKTPGKYDGVKVQVRYPDGSVDVVTTTVTVLEKAKAPAVQPKPEPITPIKPIKPVEPVKEVKPVKPVEPIKEVKPVEIAPAKPVVEKSKGLINAACNEETHICIIHGFAVDARIPNKEEQKNIQRIANLVNDFASKGVADITGHTDSTGTVKYNQRLSVYRAQNVAKLLRKFGLKDSIKFNKIIGHGELDPMDTNRTKAGRYNNRRVEIHFLDLER